VFVVVQATGSDFDLVGAEIKAVGAIGDETVTEFPSGSGVELPQDEEAGDEGNEGNEGDEGNEGTCRPRLPRFRAAALSLVIMYPCNSTDFSITMPIGWRPASKIAAM
jgi:hypothetical protein